jgi:hypothetical protein
MGTPTLARGTSPLKIREQPETSLCQDWTTFHPRQREIIVSAIEGAKMERSKVYEEADATRSRTKTTPATNIRGNLAVHTTRGQDLNTVSILGHPLDIQLLRDTQRMTNIMFRDHHLNMPPLTLVLPNNEDILCQTLVAAACKTTLLYSLTTWVKPLVLVPFFFLFD